MNPETLFGRHNRLIGLQHCLLALACLLGSMASVGANATEPPAGSPLHPPSAAIASAHPAATEAGLRILQQGGNAFDAAVAVSAVLAVVEPFGSGIGGGGFWLLHRAKDRHQVMIDGRETAPMGASRDMYLDGQGRPQKQLSLDGPLAAGIPGLPAGLVHLSQHYGRLPLSDALQPAIEWAESGFEVDETYRRLAGFRLQALQASPAASAIFLEQNRLPALGFVVKQVDLADTLRQLSERGFDGFYRGQVAQKLIAGVQAHGGIWTPRDLTNYKVKERPPVVHHYRGIRVVSAPPPSSGGVVMSQALNFLAGYDLASYQPVERTHLVTEAMRWAYRDRARYLGDPDFVAMPLGKLTSPAYAALGREGIRLDVASPRCSHGLEAPEKGTDTTHFSVMDREGNRVAATLSVNYPFGSGFVPEGSGVLLNDEMDDFSMSPGVANAYGLVGREANSIEPGKRMLSSMTPTFLETPDRIAILGTPGGSRIISMVLLGVLQFAEGKGPADWVAQPRYHHQCLPNVIQHEPGAFSADLKRSLEAKGHVLKTIQRRYGNMQAILWHTRSARVEAASDPRRNGLATVTP